MGVARRKRDNHPTTPIARILYCSTILRQFCAFTFLSASACPTPFSSSSSSSYCCSLFIPLVVTAVPCFIFFALQLCRYLPLWPFFVALFSCSFCFYFFILRFYCHSAFSFSLSLLWSTLKGSSSGGDSAECRKERSVRCLLSSCPIELRVQCKYFNYSCCYSMGSLH